MFENSKWIWIANGGGDDEYGEFKIEFDLESIKDVKLCISADGNFEARLSGSVCAIGACSDYPEHKKYDEFSLDKFCRVGKNELVLNVWHIGAPSMTYAVADAGVIFSITQGERELCVSSEATPSRKNLSYTNGLCKYITSQLGISYRYDNTVEVDESPFTSSVLVEKAYDIARRPIENMVLLPRIDTTVSDDGERILIDWGKEAAGYLDLDIISEGAQELLITFGEHLDDCGRVPRIIGKRDFSIGFVARDGENKFFGGMRRIAGRYIEIEYKNPIKVEYVGIRPAVYPVKIKEKLFEKAIHKKIYDTSVYTLICCMHEHYEDCPWREQALYSLDSRNQMLCGYIAFDEYRYARYNITLLAQGLNNGILRITSPSDIELAIPFFSLTFIQQVYEYVQFSGDDSIVSEIKDTLDEIVKTFSSKIDESGLIPAFLAPAWNFYEWSDGNDGSVPVSVGEKRYDCCLNAMFVYVYEMYKRLGGCIEVDMGKMKDAIKHVLFDESRGLFKNSTLDGRFSLISNSLAILAGVGDVGIAERLIKERDELIDITLSMNAYFYDALLSLGGGYRDYIIRDIEEKYTYMLSQGATTFWETIDGWHAFSDAGSLCHGWSALPVYYLDKLL